MKPSEYKKEAKKLDMPSINELIKSLEEQKKQHIKQSKYHRDMSLKAEGAIEILTQIDSKK